MRDICDIAIIGAGPYGLSLAAHLHDRDVDLRIFGKPLSTWREHMPKGMNLKSDGFASNLSAPDPASTLKSYCTMRGVAYDDRLLPVTLSLFNDYAGWFQKRYVPMLDERNVAGLQKTAHGFRLTLGDGHVCEAANVVLAVGITWFANMPDILRSLPSQMVSHSFNAGPLERFAGRDVVILGAGSSAIDTAALLADADARATLLARRPHLHFHGMPDPNSGGPLRRITHPSSGIGPGWRSFFCSRMPRLFRRLPSHLRLEATRRHLGPAAGWFMRGRIEGRVATLLGAELTKAEVRNGHIELAVSQDGRNTTVTTDHVIAATGYRPDLRRLDFISEGIRERILQIAHTPELSGDFETSQDRLYVVGALAANSFGPLMRFMVGAEYVAPRLARHLRGVVKRTRKIRGREHDHASDPLSFGTFFPDDASTPPGMDEGVGQRIP